MTEHFMHALATALFMIVLMVVLFSFYLDIVHAIMCTDPLLVAYTDYVGMFRHCK